MYIENGGEVMSTGFVIDIISQAIWNVILISAPMLLLGLVVGLVISIFQATTQIQEQTLAFIPKILAVFAGIVLFGPWMLTRMMDFTKSLFMNMSSYIK
jgi:flagellar biosynthetic protein FliQ